MIETLLQSTIDLSARESNWAQVALAGAVIVAILAFAIAQGVRLRRTGTSGEQRRQRRYIDGQLQNAPSRLVLITAEMSRWDRERAIRDCLPGVDGDSDVATEVPTVRTALTRTGRAVETGLPDVPPLVRRLSFEAVATLLFGSVLFVSIATWQRQLTSGTSLSVPDLSPLGDAVAELADIVLQVLASFPFAELIYSLALTAVIQAARFLYERWVVVFVVLVVGIATLLLVDTVLRRRNEDPERIAPADVVGLRTVGVGVGRVLVAGAAVGVVANALGWLITEPAVIALDAGVDLPLGVDTVATIRTGLEVVALVIALVVGAVLGKRAVVRTWVRARTAVGEVAATSDGRSQQLFGVLLGLRTAYGAFSLLIVPIIFAWAVQAIETGDLGTVISLLIAAPALTKVAVVAFLVVLVFAVVVRGRAALAEAGSLWALALGQRALSLVLFLSLGPVVAGIALAGGLFVLGAPALWAVVLGLGAMTTLRVGVMAARRGRQKVHARRADDSDVTPTRAYVAGFRLEDADGENIWVVRIGAREYLSHRSPEALVETVGELLEHYFTENRIPTAVAHHHWKNVQEGIVSWDFAERQVRREARRTMLGVLDEHGGPLEAVELAEELDEDIFDHVDEMHDVQEEPLAEHDPDSVVAEQRLYLEREGKISSRRNGDVLVLN